MKTIISYIFAVLFRIFKAFPLNNKKITFIMTHDDKFNGKLKYIYEDVKKIYPSYKVNIISKKDYEGVSIKSLKKPVRLIISIIDLFFIKNYYLATSKYVFLNNIFITGAYLRFKKEVQVIQFWHAMGTFKKFGEDYIPDDKVKKLQRKANQIYTSVIVHSPLDIEAYARAFGVNKERIKVAEDPSCRIFFDERKREEIINKLRRVYPQIKDKKVVLYAPTFREYEEGNKEVIKNIKKLANELKEDYVVMVRLHPHIYKKYDIENLNVIDVSDYIETNELLLVVDVLITDYSSIIYPFALLDRPILFWGFDLEYYEKYRGFYENYDDFIPGDKIYNVRELEKYLLENNIEKVKKFKAWYYQEYEFLQSPIIKNIIEDL